MVLAADGSVEMNDPTKEPCRYCGDPVGEEGARSGTCDHCWYGMRLAPDEWEAEMKAKGREVHYQRGCLPIEGGGFMCRNPWAPGPPPQGED